jgi:sigma-B regulation protein RsbU (phosphoserine phosphatase)
LKDVEYAQDTIALAEGDLVIAYTDGISETMNKSDEEWGEENLIDAVRQCQGLSARETMTRIMVAADRFAAGARQHDDMTLSVLRVLPSEVS